MSLIPPEFIGPFPIGIKPVHDGVYALSGEHRGFFAEYLNGVWGLMDDEAGFVQRHHLLSRGASQNKSWYGLTKAACDLARLDSDYFATLEKKARELP